MNVVSGLYNSVFYPPAISSVSHICYQSISIVLTTIGYNLVDPYLTKSILKSAKYFVVHTITNALIVCFSFGSSFSFLRDPANSLMCPITGCFNQVPNVLTAALHLYHMLKFSMKRIDIIHHIPCLISTFINMILPSGPIQNFNFLFIMGIPGGIDYACLTLVKYGVMDKMTEKRINSFLNMYIRSPGLLFTAFGGIQNILTHQFIRNSLPLSSLLYFIIAHNIWNAQYFMYKAIETEVKHTNKAIE